MALGLSQDQTLDRDHCWGEDAHFAWGYEAQNDWGRMKGGHQEQHLPPPRRAPRLTLNPAQASSKYLLKPKQERAELLGTNQSADWRVSQSSQRPREHPRPHKGSLQAGPDRYFTHPSCPPSEKAPHSPLPAMTILRDAWGPAPAGEEPPPLSTHGCQSVCLSLPPFPNK